MYLDVVNVYAVVVCECVVMGIAVLFILKSRLLLYTTGSG